MTVDHPGFVPGVLLGGGDGSGRRTARDWAVDALVLVVALGGGFGFLVSLRDGPQGAVLVLDAAAGVVSSLLLLRRREAPAAVGLVTTALAFVSVGSSVPSLVAVFSVAVHRRIAPALWIAVLNLVASLVAWSLYPSQDSFATTLVVSFAVLGAAVAWGAFVRARRQLVLSLRDRAERAEAEQRLRADQARQAERGRIAREMHDVVAHRVSLVALHAGGLQVRPDLPADQVRETAELIRRSAQDALDELRAVVGVLREGGEGMEVPQPGLRDVVRLVEESVRAGAHVDLELEVDDPDGAPAALGRDAFRIVQEGLTNVHKHATGTSTRVCVRGGPGEGLHVSVRNRLPLHAGPPALTGAGAGLLGLTERVSLSGGELAHGRTTDGDFVVEADLRWPA